MKLLITLTCCSLLCSSAAIAQTAQRDLLIDKIESCYAGPMFSVDSPFTEILLRSAKSANPSVTSDNWSKLKKEIAPALSKIMTEKGGPIDLIFGKPGEKMSDGELDTLAQILCNPVYSKFQTEMGSALTQQQFVKAMLIYTAKINEVINGVLTQNGLKEVH